MLLLHRSNSRCYRIKQTDTSDAATASNKLIQQMLLPYRCTVTVYSRKTYTSVSTQESRQQVL